MKYLKLYENFDEDDYDLRFEAIGCCAVVLHDCISTLLTKKKLVIKKYAKILSDLTGYDVFDILKNGKDLGGSEIYEDFLFDMSLKEIESMDERLTKIQNQIEREESIELDVISDELLMNEIQAICDYGVLIGSIYKSYTYDDGGISSEINFFAKKFLYKVKINIDGQYCDYIIFNDDTKSHFEDVNSLKKEVIDDIFHIKENLELMSVSMIWKISNRELTIYLSGPIKHIDNSI